MNRTINHIRKTPLYRNVSNFQKYFKLTPGLQEEFFVLVYQNPIKAMSKIAKKHGIIGVSHPFPPFLPFYKQV
jgi:hypothetical protein